MKRAVWLLACLVVGLLLVSWWLQSDKAPHVDTVRAAEPAAEPVEVLAASFEKSRENATRLATSDRRDKETTVAAQHRQWPSEFMRNELSIEVVFASAPLAAKVEKLARNKSLNPSDEVLSESQLAALRTIVDSYRSELEKIEATKGTLRHAEMMERLNRGELPSVDALSSKLTGATLADIERKIAGLPDPDSRERMRRFLLKEQLMQTLGSDAAITTPSGEVFLAENGSMRPLLGSYEEYSQFLRDDFFGSVVSFFAANGLLDDFRTLALLRSYFGRRR